MSTLRQIIELESVKIGVVLLILGGMQMAPDALAANLKDFADRAYGRSPSGVVWSDRSNTASVARTVHIFESVEGPFTA